MDLIERARLYVGRMPVAESGAGGHNTTFHVACVLVQGFGFTPDQALPLLAEYNQKCLPPWSESELRHKLAGADRAVSEKGRGFLAKGAEWTPSKDWQGYHSMPEIKKASFEADKLQKFSGDWAKKIDLVWLANRSAVDPSSVTPSSFLEALYQAGEKVCVFTGEFAGTIGDGVEIWPEVTPATWGKCGVWFLPQPVDGGYHPTDKEGKMSCRNHRAVTAWRYMVIESDQANTRDWLGAIVQLPLRISALYSSGGRSVHALVRVDAATKGQWDEERDKIKGLLTVLGADPKTLTAVRLTRLPGCMRHGKMKEILEGGKKVRKYEAYNPPKLQKLLYLNPRPELAALLDYFPRRDVVKYWTDLAAAGVADSDETGGQWIKDGLGYYAGVNRDAWAALQEMEGME